MLKYMRCRAGLHRPPRKGGNRHGPASLSASLTPAPSPRALLPLSLSRSFCRTWLGRRWDVLRADSGSTLGPVWVHFGRGLDAVSSHLLAPFCHPECRNPRTPSQLRACRSVSPPGRKILPLPAPFQSAQSRQPRQLPVASSIGFPKSQMSRNAKRSHRVNPRAILFPRLHRSNGAKRTQSPPRSSSSIYGRSLLSPATEKMQRFASHCSASVPDLFPIFPPLARRWRPDAISATRTPQRP